MANPVQLFSGIEGRNSSRVTAPPGGASSIFFGDYEAPPVNTRKQQARGCNPIVHSQQPPVQPLQQHQQPPAVHHQAYPAAAAPTPQEAPVRAQQSYQEAYHAHQAQAPAQGYGKKSSNMHGAHQTILAETKHRDVHTSSRVLAPPGGRCHNIFG